MGSPEAGAVVFEDMVAFATVDTVEVSMVVGACVMVEEEFPVAVTAVTIVPVAVCEWLVELEELEALETLPDRCPVAVGLDEIMAPSIE